MTFKTVQLKKDVFDMLEPAKEEFLRHHPEMEGIAISNNKIIYETVKFYLAVESGNRR